MNDYICPECGHTPEDHNSPVIVGCCYPDGTKAGGVCPCRLSKDDVYEAIITSQAQTITEAREVLKPFNFETWASAWDGFPDDFMLEQLSITVGDLRKAAEWLKKYP